MHGLCSNGVLNWVASLVIQAILESGLETIWTTLHGLVGLWKHPAVHGCPLQTLFDAKAAENHKKASKMKCSASEILALYPILQHYVHCCCNPAGVCLLEAECYLKRCDVLDYCVAIPSLDMPQPSCLLHLVEAALGALVSAGWSEEMKPKMHWALHYSDALKAHKQLCACWAMERKHKDVRKYGVCCAI